MGADTCMRERDGLDPPCRGERERVVLRTWCCVHAADFFWVVVVKQASQGNGNG